MDLNLVNKRVLISGSSRGIGKTIASHFYQAGSKIVLNGRNIQTLISAKNELEGSNYVCGDVSDPFQAEKIIKETVKILGGLDILICNVGSGKSVPPGQENHIEWVKSFNTNFFSTTNLIENSLHHLQQNKGSIVCISSICGLEVIKNAPVTYSVSKAALNMYVKGISKPLGKKNIRINAIAPGNINFEGSIWQKKLISNRADVINMLNENVSLTKLGAPEDVANLVTFLSSSISNFITGSIFQVDGGQLG